MVSFLQQLHEAVRDRALSDDDASLPDALIVSGLWPEDDLPPSDALASDVAALMAMLDAPNVPLRDQKAAACVLSTVATDLDDALRADIRRALAALLLDRARPEALRLSGVESAEDLPPGSEHVAAVTALFADRAESVRVRTRAAWILSGVRSDELSEPALDALITSHRDPDEPLALRKTLSSSLARLHQPRAYDALLDAIERRDAEMFESALHAFSLVACVRDSGDAVRASRMLRELAARTDEAPPIRTAATWILADVVDREGETRALLARLLFDPDAPELTRRAAARALQNHLGDAHVDIERLALLALDRGAPTPLREAVVDTLRALTATRVPFPEHSVVLTPPREAEEIARSSRRVSELVVPCLTRLIEGADEPRSLRSAATAALGRLPNREGTPALVATLLDEALPDELRGSAAHALAFGSRELGSGNLRAMEAACETIAARNPERSYPARQARSLLKAIRGLDRA